MLNKDLAVSRQLIESKLFALPEKVLQFGTGVLLRGLPDFLIHQANVQGIFNGRIVVVKSTNSDSSDFDKQDSVYTVNVKGLDENNQIINESSVVNSISRVIAATENWKGILALAANKDMNIILSNTTEVGIQYVEEDIFVHPPSSFPAKLTAFLFERYKKFNGSFDAGMVIVPTELLVGNGDLLKGIVFQHIARQKLSNRFKNWVTKACYFSNTLVDRIVPGKPSEENLKEVFEKYGYQDNLCIDTEQYLLFAIQGNEKVKKALSFAQIHPNVIIDEDITQYREQKLRLLNGGHSISVSLSYLMGKRTVLEMMQDKATGKFVEEVIFEEILPTLDFDATDFAKAVIRRFQNPYIEHKLINITVQNSSKMNMRNALTMERYIAKFGKIPEKMAKGFAAYLLFTRPTGNEKDTWKGEWQGNSYPIKDDAAPQFYEFWKGKSPKNAQDLNNLVETVLNNAPFKASTLKENAAFKKAVVDNLLLFN